MEPIQKRAQIDPQQLIPGKAGLAKSYSRARNGAVTRESQARGGRSEEVQAERKNEARSKEVGRERSTQRGRRGGSRGSRGSSRSAASPGVKPGELQGQVGGANSELGEFAAKLEQKSASKVTSKTSIEQQPVALKGAEQEAPALVSAATQSIVTPAVNTHRSSGGGAVTKTSSVTQRGAELSASATGRAQPKEAEKKPSLAKAQAAAPTPEREQASDILKQVRLQLSPETRSATVNLKPAELGRVSIRIVVDGDQVQAVVRAETPEALAALEQYMPELQAALGDRGFQDADLELSLGFDGEDRDQSEDLHVEESVPTKIHRLFMNDEEVDYFA